MTYLFGRTYRVLRPFKAGDVFYRLPRRWPERAHFAPLGRWKEGYSLECGKLLRILHTCTDCPVFLSHLLLPGDDIIRTIESCGVSATTLHSVLSDRPSDYVGW